MTLEQLATEDRILNAAEAEFMEHGYHGARMQAIADNAQINKAMLHYYFRTKDQLFERIFTEKAKYFFPKVLKNMESETDFISMLQHFVDDYYELLLAHPYLPYFIVVASGTNPSMFDRLKPEFPPKMALAYQQALAEGKVRKVDPMHLVISVMSMCVMPFAVKNLICQTFGRTEPEFMALMHTRAAEIKQYLSLILEPERS